MTTIVAGDDVRIPITLKKNGATFSIDTGATVKANLISRDKAVLAGPITCLSTDPGSNWADSLINVYFPSASTLSIGPQNGAMIEMQVDDGGKLTWFSTGITIETGTID